ncbi:hypothetical protein Smp_018880 [Schistosoma mansoni]|uniref:hypothetical protein n=1 Tax=Schistosoma mansoni TaxID=6183 RepID=UPI0001A642E2|nr:hypothetical protein Smp_018880 [Schistosoma mansoni]|eukprot:XP_018651484.1 hypothetical protein Smp_018880 [Schistosoma mansoni]
MLKDAISVGVEVGGDAGIKAGLGLGGGAGVKAGLVLGRGARTRNGYRDVRNLLIAKRLGRGTISGEVSGGSESSRTVRREVIIDPGQEDSEETVQRKKIVKTREIIEVPAEEESSTKTRKTINKRTIIDDDSDSSFEI